MIAFRVALVQKIVLKSRSYKKKKLTLSLALSQTNQNYKSKKTAFLNVFFVFLWKCVPWRFFLLQFYLIHFSLLSRSLVRFVVRSLVSQRFIQKTIVRLSVCVCVLHLRVLFCVSVLFSFFLLGVYLWLAVCVVLLQYQIANMVQISQINLICFLLLFFC